jgi:hypothetical protein
MVVPKPVVKVIALAIVILLLVPVVAGVSVPRVLAEDVAVSDVDRSKLIMLAMIALMFSDIPLDQVERYELLNTLYIYRNGSVELVKSPYLPGDLVLSITRIVAEIKRSTNISYAVSEGRVDVYINGLLAYSIVYGENLSSWSLWVGELRNKSIDSNTVMYWRRVRANLINSFVDYYAIYLVRNVSDTHRIYIASVAELKPNYSGYSYVFTYANYWFKNKTTFYGDWIVLPEGASSLSDYYRLVAYGVKWLSQNVYNGASPGYFTRGRNSGYVPQAYPQIANALETLASNIPAEINLPVEKGYALATDLHPLVVSVLAGALGGFLAYVGYWAVSTGCDISKWSWREAAAWTVAGALSGLGYALGYRILTGEWP